MALLGFKGTQDKADQPVFVGGNVHRAQIVAQEVDALANQLFGGRNTPRDDGFVDLGLLAQEVHQAAFFLADNRAAIVDLNLLLDNQAGNQGCNVDFLPAIGDCLIPALHIAHRGLEQLLVLQLQPLTDLVESVLVVCTQSREADFFISAVEDGKNIGVAVHKLIDHVELGVDALDKALHRLIQLVLCRAVFQVKDFTVNIELALDDSFFNHTAGVTFQLPCLIVAVADDPLDALRHLRHVPLLDVLADLHCLFQLVKVGRVRRENDDCFVVDLRVHDEPLISDAVEVACHSDDAKPHSAGGRAVQCLVHILIVGKVILAVFIFLCRIDFAVDCLRNALDDLCAVNRRILDVDGNILFLVRQEGVGIAVAGDVVLRQEAFQRSRDGRTEGNLVRVNIVDHQDSDVLDVRLDIFNVADEVEQLEDVHVLLFQAVVGVRRILAAVDDPADSTLQEGMYRVVELIERHKGVLVLVFDFLCRLLEAGQHGAFAARKMLAGVAVLTDLRENLLDDDELIRNKGEGRAELCRAGKALDVEDGVIEGKQTLETRSLFLVLHLQKMICILRFRQNTLFDDLINGRGRQAQAGIEASLNLGEVIAGDSYDGINRFLTRDHDPDLAPAFVTDFFNQRLQIHHQIAIVTDVLTDLIHAEQEAEVSFLAVYILLDLRDELLDAHVGVLFAVEPVAGCCLAHAENRLQNLNHIVLEEGGGIAGVDPLVPVDFLKSSAEGVCLALLVNEAFQLRHLEVFAIEAAVVIEHLCKDTQHSGLVLVDRSFDVDVEQDGFRGNADAFLHRRIHHRIVKLVRKVIKGVFAVHLFVGEKVGEHFQEVRFTTSKEAGNPDADFVGRIVDGFDVVIKERGKMTPQFFRDNVLAEFLL